jgi:hypothetical protein
MHHLKFYARAEHMHQFLMRMPLCTHQFLTHTLSMFEGTFAQCMTPARQNFGTMST